MTGPLETKSKTSAGGDTRTGFFCYSAAYRHLAKRPEPDLACSMLPMSNPWRIRASLALNAALIGLCIWSLAGRSAPRPPPSAVPAQLAAPATPVAFRWSQLEAGDYPTYMRNLRAVGCPEETIRDIITADIDSQYAELRSNPGAAGSDPQEDHSFVASSPPGSPLRREPAGSQTLADKQGAANSAVAPAAQPRPALKVQELDRQQANLRASLFPPAVLSAPQPQPTVPLGATSGAAAPTPASETHAAESANAAAAGVSAAAPAPRRATGYLTPEQQQLRAKIGWQAFYFTTKEENDQVRAAQGKAADQTRVHAIP